MSAKVERLRYLYDDAIAKYSELEHDCNTEMLEHEKTIQEKDAAIKKLKERCEKPWVVKMNKVESFVSEPRKNA